ncbi:MAG: Hsp20/alpha crystallin family protein [Deltaproteobacteria bacterium]|nr:Hsp20/alpha crystallin family protein [Deltaproteobacteria bacterium]
MTDRESKELQAKEKTAVSTPAESTKPGPVFAPAVDILENEKELILLADIPGVNSSDLSIDLNDSVLTLFADAEPPEKPNESDIFREYRTGKYFRQFTVSEAIDQSKIEAELKDGVLHLHLPKVEAATPRKIAVKAG